LNHDIFDRGVLGDGPIFLVLDVSFFSAFGFTLLAKFLALAGAFFAAAFALLAVALALAGAFFAAAFALLAVALALAGAFFAAAFALLATALVAEAALSALFAADAIFLATAAFIPALINLEAPAEATLDTVSNLASTSFFAVAAPTPGNAVNFSILDALVCEAILSPITSMKASFLEVFL
jgi:hypothetical protein